VANGRVVVADGDRRAAGVLTWLLSEQGLEATLAHPPRSVEYALQWRTPEVLLVDGDDAELTALVKRLVRDDRFSNMRVIVASRRDDDGIGRVPEGAHDCVEKPYRAHEVVNRVTAQLRASAELASARDVLQDAQGQVERARDSSASNRRLAEVLRDIADELSTPEIYRVLARRVGRALGVRHCAVILADGDAQATTATVAAALEEPAMTETAIALADYPEIARALATGRPVLVEDAERDPVFAEVRQRMAGEGRSFHLRSVIALPFAMGESNGALFIRTDPNDRKLTAEDAEFAELVMHAAVAAIRRGKALETSQADNRRLEELATTDPLTRVLNRRALTDRLGVEMDRAKRFRADLSVLLVDVDYFKRINDTAGHLVGDEILRQFATRLEEAVRTVDIVARYGGEEFVLILPETGKEGGKVFGERLCERFAAHQFGVGGRNIRLTVSVGLATFPSPQIASADDFFARADEALYRAKANGRNQVRS
jgi:two-component system, cell cycle response regulator